MDGWIADDESSRLKLTDAEQSVVARYKGEFCVTGFMVQLDELQRFVINTPMQGL